MKLSKKKLGFTLVELLVVVAILAILATVSIIGYKSFIDKANDSNDESVVTELNNYLKTANPLDDKVPTATDAYDLLKGTGLHIDELQPFNKDNKYGYNYKKKEFVVIRADWANPIANSDNYETFVFVKNLTQMNNAFTNHYSVYLQAGFDELTTTINTNFGVDVGSNAGITAINYSSTDNKTMVIRTNGGTLTIDAENATINHYGEGVVLDIQAIAGSSYHEYGYFPKAAIAQGRIVVESEGNIPSVEVTAVPTETKPVKIETSKDVVVSASQEVVAALGENTKLENIEVKISNTQAAVAVDEKINSADVTINGQTASEQQLVSIKKVSTLSELLEALNDQEKYIMFSNDIVTNGTDLINLTYSVTIDGNGHKLTGNGGLRNSVRQMICFGWEAPELVEKIVVKDLSIETTTVARALECRGNTKEIVFEGVTLKSSGSGNDQGFTFGGNYSDLMKLTLKNCDFSVSGDGYTFILFNAVDMVIENSTISGWAGLYFKSPSSSHGARDSRVYISNSDFICHNVNWGATNAFGAIVFEDGNIDVTLVDSNLDVTSESDQEQCAILFSNQWASYFGTNLKNGHVIIKGDSSINGSIDTANPSYDLSNDIKIEGGIFTSDPSDYVADGYTVSRNGSLYIIK